MFDRNIDDHDLIWRILRARLWDAGHTFTEIDNMSLQDVGDILGFWSETRRANEKIGKYRKNSGG